MNATYEHRKTLGLCTQCGSPDAVGTRCGACLDKAVLGNKKRSHNRKDLNLRRRALSVMIFQARGNPEKRAALIQQAWELEKAAKGLPQANVTGEEK